MMIDGISRLGEAGGRHLYKATVYRVVQGILERGALKVIEIEANNRSQAEHIANRADYVVCDMNMVG